jgi:thiamine-monophosphate kinase
MPASNTPPTSFFTEQDLVAWLRSLPKPNPGIWPVGIGDDAAILHPSPNDELVISTDMLLEGSCFLIAQAGPLRVGRKALAVNLSDLAAMAARPLGCFLSLALPKSGDRSIAQKVIQGLLEKAAQFNCPLLGGDTNSWNGPLAISVTVIGTTLKGKAVRRNGAKLGDWLLVTGQLGGSILGHHLDFTARITEALIIADMVQIHAMMDISDGLARDTRTLCEASGLGACLHADHIPISSAAHQLQAIAALGIAGSTPLEHALGDGEDYELLMAVSPADGQKLLSSQPLQSTSITKVGECVAEGFWLLENNKRNLLQNQGWQHNWA